MKSYLLSKRIPSIKLPRILGLTASIIQRKCKPDEVKKMLRDLESTLDSHLVTSVDYEEVRKYTTKPKIMLVAYSNSEMSPLSEYGQSVVEKLGNLAEQVKNMTQIDYTTKKAFSRVLRNIGYVIESLGEWCGARAIKYELDIFDDLDINNNDKNVIAVGSMIRGELSNMHTGCKIHEETFTDSLKHVSHKVSRLLQVVRKYNDTKNLAGLVFVNMRCCAFLLSELLNILQKSNPVYSMATSRFVVGNNTKKFGDFVYADRALRKQAETLIQFKKGMFRFLVSTSVLEEGVDIQKCNLVIRFDEPSNYRSYVQSKGRARANEAKYILLHDSSSPTNTLNKDVLLYERLEKELQIICHNRALPSLEEMIEAFSDDLLKPFMPFGPTGSRITSSSCISLLNRYCSRLPHDKFTLLRPQIKIMNPSTTTDPSESDEMLTAEVSLPNNAAYRLPVLGDPMPNTNWAKKSAALKMCQKLYEMGELNEDLLPLDIKAADESLIDALIGNIEQETVPGKIGTKKRCQIFHKKICSTLGSDLGSSFFLYKINITSVKTILDGPELNNDNCMGLLSANELYHCSFPLYNNKWGEVSVTLGSAQKRIIDNDTIKNIEHFQRTVFELLLNINNDVLEFDRQKSEFKCLIVPLTFDAKIDKNLLNTISVLPNLNASMPSVSERQRFVFDPSLYRNAIVIPWYKSKDVFRVYNLTNLVPSSEFPIKEHLTYNDYFKNVYNVDIINQTQNLLECGGVSTKFNCLSPVTYRTSKKVVKRPMLVPELCYLVPIPGQLFHHIHFLPSILHRLNAINVSADFIRYLDILPIMPPSKEIDYEWCQKYTQDILESSTSANLCVALQENDTMRFNEYNFMLEAMCQKPDVTLQRSNRSQISCQRTLSPLHVLQCIVPQSAGDRFNLERLEVLGDSFLKFHIGQMLYMQHSTWNEGRLSLNRYGCPITFLT